MWRQLIISLTGLAIGWNPMPATHPKPLQKAVAMPSVYTQMDRDVRCGQEAIVLALEEVTRALIDVCDKKYGGFLVSRRCIERKVRKEIGKSHDAIFKYIQENYMADGVPIQFNMRTAQVTYSKQHCLRSVSVAQIADSILELRKKL